MWSWLRRWPRRDELIFFFGRPTIYSELPFVVVSQQHREPGERACRIDWLLLVVCVVVVAVVRAVARVEALAAGRAEAWTRSVAQRLKRQIGQDILAQDLIEIDLVVLVDEQRVFIALGRLQGQPGADVGAGEEFFVELALDFSGGIFQAPRTFEEDVRRVLAVDQDALRRPGEMDMAMDRPVEVQLVARVGEGLGEVEVAGGAGSEQQQLRNVDGYHKNRR